MFEVLPVRSERTEIMKNINNPTNEHIFEEARIYCLLTNDLTDSWKTVLKWKGISQAELSRRTGLTRRTINSYIRGKKNSKLEYVVLMCLAVHLPGEISEIILNLSGHSLVLSKRDHIIFNHLLRHKYNESLSEIRDFLLDSGEKIYKIFPADSQK